MSGIAAFEAYSPDSGMTGTGRTYPYPTAPGGGFNAFANGRFLPLRTSTIEVGDYCYGLPVAR